jgi:formate dehydrogenase subunit delta
MVNQIAGFFSHEGPERGAASVADHLQKFWDPRMRDAICAHVDSGGEGLTRAPDMPSATDAGMTAAKHRGYAFQWYSLALLTLALFLFFALFRHDKPPRDT